MDQYQSQMRLGYVNGAPGVAVSAFAWLAAGVATHWHSEYAGMATLFFAGMVIHPLSILICSSIFHRPPPDASNPLNRLAIESTIALFAGVFVGYAGANSSPGFFFNVMLLIIGARYFVFQTIYGIRLYWILGAAMAAAGVALMIAGGSSAAVSGFVGGAIELGFATTLFLTKKDAVPKSTGEVV